MTTQSFLLEHWTILGHLLSISMPPGVAHVVKWLQFLIHYHNSFLISPFLVLISTRLVFDFLSVLDENPRTLSRWNFCNSEIQAQNTATKFGIRSVPTFMFMEGTNVVDQVGGMDQDQLEEKCRKYGTPKKGEPKMIDVYCTLEELYNGT